MIDISAWRPRAAALGAVAALVWAVSLYGLLVDEGLIYALAVVPRRFDGLSGILGAPLVHGSFAHLAQSFTGGVRRQTRMHAQFSLRGLPERLP